MLAPHLNTVIGPWMGLPEKRGDVGIEIELEGDNLPLEATNWLVKAEGSLRGKGGRVLGGEEAPDTPREYVSRQPFTLASVSERVDVLNTAIKANNGIVRLSDRASTHIHLNLTRETFGTFFGFLLVYAAVEPVLLRLCGPKRNGNLFCIPTYETWDLPYYARHAAKCLAKGTNKYGWPARGKYGALNPDPLRTLGSVEVRCFPNSVDSGDIAFWASWLGNMRVLAQRMRPPFDDDLSVFGADGGTLLRSVFGSIELSGACAPHHPLNLVQFGLEHAHEIRESLEPVLNWTDSAQNKTEPLTDSTMPEWVMTTEPTVAGWDEI